MKPSRQKAALAAILVIAAGAAVWRFTPDFRARAETPAPAAALTVSVVEPQYRQWPDTIEANGSTAAWQEAVIGAETGSLRITEVLADVGSKVKRGHLLARLDDATATADLRKQEAAVAQARANLEQAEDDLKRSRQAADSGHLPQMALARAVEIGSSEKKR